MVVVSPTAGHVTRLTSTAPRYTANDSLTRSPVSCRALDACAGTGLVPRHSLVVPTVSFTVPFHTHENITLMKARQSVLLEAARNVQAFLDTNTAVIGPTITAARQNLDDAAAQLAALAVTQQASKTSSRGATSLQAKLRVSLRTNYMRPVATVAKLFVADVPEIDALRMPKKQVSSAALVAAAHAMADAAQTYSDTFTKYGLPDDFVAQLRSAADAVTSAITGRQTHIASTAGATSGLAEQESRVRSLLKLINALVVPKLGTNIVLLNEWKVARAIDNTKPITPTVTSASGGGFTVSSTPTTPASSGTNGSSAGVGGAPASTASPADATQPPAGSAPPA